MAFYLRDQQGHFQEAHAVTSALDLLESAHLSGITSAQTAELLALVRACHLAERKPAHIYSASQSAFRLVHNHGRLWKQRISDFLWPVYSKESTNLSIIRCFSFAQLAILTIPGHSEPNTEEAKDNNLTDKTARRTELHRAACAERVCPAPCGCSISDLLQLNRWYNSKNWTPGTEGLKFQPAKQF